jgi:hypothetical protein
VCAVWSGALVGGAHWWAHEGHPPRSAGRGEARRDGRPARRAPLPLTTQERRAGWSLVSMQASRSW